jgi:peptidoglycan/LPS O-acetylase OafA/YrhL
MDNVAFATSAELSRPDSRRPSWLDGGRVPALDGLRAASIVLVLLEHSSLSTGFPAIPKTVRLGAIGIVGVSMFFAISGFLITLLLAREWRRSGTVSMRGFYRRRALRILPAYVAFLLVAFVLTRLDVVSLTSRDWVGALTYTMNFVMNPTWEVGHIWSLSVEEQFYLVWPVLLLVLTPRRALYVVGTYIVAVPFVRLAVWAFSRESLALITDQTPLRLDAIAVGCLLALLMHRGALSRLQRWVENHAGAISFTAASAIAASHVLGSVVTAYRVTFHYSVQSCAMAAIIWAMSTAPRLPITRILQSRVATTIGLWSYSLYLWQQLFLNPHRVDWTTTWPNNLVCAVAAAVASYYVIELPFLRIKDRAAEATARAQVLEAAPSHHVAQQA